MTRPAESFLVQTGHHPSERPACHTGEARRVLDNIGDQTPNLRRISAACGHRRWTGPNDTGQAIRPALTNFTAEGCSARNDVTQPAGPFRQLKATGKGEG